MEIKAEELISSEIKRITDKFGKEYLDYSDIMKITGLGRDNVRAIMTKIDFPKIRVGKRRIVSVAAFVTWQFTNELRGGEWEEKRLRS